MALDSIQLIQGLPRQAVKAADALALRHSGALVEDPRRERPRYFDGRFLAARDLIRDQQYFLTREADLGRAAGSGVAWGLDVSAGATPNSLRIGAGEGFTPAGELVLLPQQLDINLANIPAAELLSAKFGLGRLPAPPLRSRTGLFVLALRPVEFTANPVGAYPTSLTGPRTVQDGDVIEATAIVLVPWQDDGATDALQARRGRAARTIFTQDARAIASANVLPVAMVALQSNTLVWIDEAMVRRELGADRGDLPGLGLAPRGLRLAHLIQHQSHLADVVKLVQGRSFAAATQFPALPPAGPLPPGVIDIRDFTQRYFPSEVDVDFSIVPDDELPAIVEEALALPPIDFLASESALDLTAVLILAPVPRADFRAVLAKLNSRTRVLKPAAPNRLAQQKPLEILQRLRLPLPFVPPNVANPSDAEWARLAQLPTLWFVRRRNLAYRDDLVGNGVAATGDQELALEAAVRGRITSLGLTPRLNTVMAAATSKAAWSVMSLLAVPRIADSPALTAAALGALQAKISGDPGKRLLDAAVLGVGNELKSGSTGTGLLNIEARVGGQVSASAIQALASNDAWRKIDATARIATGVQLGQLVDRLSAAPVATAPASTPTTGAPSTNAPAAPATAATGTPVSPTTTAPATPTPAPVPTRPPVATVPPVVAVPPTLPVAPTPVAGPVPTRPSTGVVPPAAPVVPAPPVVAVPTLPVIGAVANVRPVVAPVAAPLSPSRSSAVADAVRKAATRAAKAAPRQAPEAAAPPAQKAAPKKAAVKKAAAKPPKKTPPTKGGRG